MLLRGLWTVIFSFVFLPAITGCQVPSYNQFVILRNVPESPSFVVIPPNNYLDQVAFANEIEAAIISVGVKVVMRPATKDVTKEVAVEGGIAAVEGSQAAHKSGEGRLIERYAAFEDIEADYIVNTYADSSQIRIMKRQTREILTVLNLSEKIIYRENENKISNRRRTKISNRRKLGADALVSMGIPIIYQPKQGGTK